ncbi:M35 family metallo-endopeptidase [Pseudoalteromonas sp. MMG005]|uniref:M35 family metallo-endopeptidase n=1 Tax=Pseudoalteromonas sp. MMG005 TaxID=2822682 RepID=UPI001B3A5115|nr:M35 family metallo-endopeptidase [Pseudoalteromonas sp. MMG005]MBQ4845934.1 peptidase M35 [Pseudoalteromonas sp. MMG005]
MKRRLLISALSSAIFVANTASAAQVSAQINFLSSLLTTEGDIHVELVLTNHDNSPVKVLKWYTAADGVQGNIFNITRDGEPVEYTGALYKRTAPSENDYQMLKPGQSINYSIELSSLYNFALPGEYRVQYQANSLHLFKAPKNEHMQSLKNNAVPFAYSALRSTAISTWVTGDPIAETVAANSTVTYNTQTLATSYTSCSNSQKNTINSAWSSAKNMSASAIGYLSSRSTTQLKTAPRYKTWFGDPSIRVGAFWSPKAHERVEENFSDITDAIKNKPLSFDCGCTSSGTFAYVYPNQPYKVYFCGAFWNASRTGTDSQAGTIIHEVSHFNAVAGTDDHAYGHYGAKNLAISNVRKAIENADSYEYFAENTPQQN